MTLIPVASQQNNESVAREEPETDALRVVGNVGAVDFTYSAVTGRLNGLDAGTGAPQNILDQNMDDMDPFAAILANPQWGGVATLAVAASFNIGVPGAVPAAHSNMFWNVERNGLFSISNGGGSLRETFLQMYGVVDDNGKETSEGEDDDSGMEAYVDGRNQLAETRRQIEWEQTRSGEFPDLNNEQVLDIMRFMDENSDEMADQAISSGKIKESEKDAYRRYIKLRRQNEEYRHTHSDQSDPALVTQIRESEAENPTFHPEFANQVERSRDRVLSAEAQQANETRSSSEAAELTTDIIAHNSDGLELIPTSNATIGIVNNRGNLSDTELNTTFNSVANTASNSLPVSGNIQKVAIASSPAPEISAAGTSFGV